MGQANRGYLIMPVELRFAKKLGEEVSGTSTSSIYIVCALSPSFHIALRDNGGTISMRVEPHEAFGFDDPMRMNFHKCGFTGDAKGHYMSQHFQAVGGDPLSRCGAYGATMEQLRYLFHDMKIATLPWKELINAGA